MKKIGINGFGRIGRVVCRINMEKEEFDVAVINDINPDNHNLAYLLKYDSTYGRLDKEITADDKSIILNGDRNGS